MNTMSAKPLETINPHENPEYIEQLFYAQIKKMSVNAARSFDFQFSGSWM
jgi:hypothetical protein